jgi:SAM-dependent methyltransferase
MIDPDAYRAAEANAARILSNRVVQVYAPVVFRDTGYPTGIERPAELAKFVDVMQETRFTYTVDYMLFGGITDAELDLAKEICRITAATLRRIGATPIIPWNALVRALLNYRHLTFVVPTGARVLELGPGSGYLGLMLALNGMKYASVDVTEGFYLWQQALYRQALGDRFVDLALDGAPALSNTLWNDCDSIHLPWWKYHTDFPDRDALRFDAVTCNHMLAEMNPASLHYLFEYAKPSRHENPEAPVFAFESFGYDLVNVPQWYVNSRFYQYGYGLCHHDSLVTVYAPQGAASGSNAAAYPVVDLSNRLDVPQIRQMAKQGLAEMWVPRSTRCPENPLSRQVMERREQHKALLRHDRGAIVQALSALLPAAALPGEAPDERALRVFGLGSV